MINILALIGSIVFLALGIFSAMRKEKILSIIALIIAVAVGIIGLSITVVPTGYVGVRTTYGQISDKPTNAGFNWHTPLTESIHLINCKQQEKDFKDTQIWSETSERTEVYCQYVVVDYQIEPEYAAWIWQNVEEWDTNLVKQTSVESGIKAATKQLNDTDVTDRSKIEKIAKESIQKALNEKYGNQILNVVSVTIGNINFSDAYNAAIEARAQKKLAAESAEYENKQKTQAIEAEAEQARIKAKGEADAKRIAAEGDAEAIKIKADAQAESNKKIAESLTPELLEKQKIDKWNGAMPKVSGSGSMIVDVGNLNDET